MNSCTQSRFLTVENPIKKPRRKHCKVRFPGERILLSTRMRQLAGCRSGQCLTCGEKEFRVGGFLAPHLKKHKSSHETTKSALSQ